MTLLDRLIRDARKSMQAHGHKPLPAQRGHQRSEAFIWCKHCSMDVHIIAKPQPNEIQIGGEAVALNCNVATIGIPEKEFGLNAVKEKMAMYAVMGC